jgi:6-phosphogluconolactonase
VSSRDVLVFPDAVTVATAVASRLEDVIEQDLATRGECHVVLTGGTVGIALLRQVALTRQIDWSDVHFWWGDERYVESSSSDRNAVQAREAMLAKLSIPETNIHEFPATDNSANLLEAKIEFLQEVRKHFGDDFPVFDLTILGMGPDGHIASLFPGHESMASGEAVVAESNSPKPPAERLSFSYEVLNSSSKIVFVVSGLDKAEAITAVHTNEECNLPAAKIQAVGETIWFIDEAAGSAFWSC